MTSLVSKPTRKLFAQPSFGSGFARGLDLFGTFDRYNVSKSAAESDRRAIASDWEAVGKDLRMAYERASNK